MKPFGRFAEYTYPLMRVMFGILFAMHGTQKLFGWFGGRVQQFPSRLFVAGVLETVLGPMVALGVFTPWAALVAAVEMAIAYVTAHAPRGPWPLVNQGELALLYFAAFLYIATRGTGRFGLTR